MSDYDRLYQNSLGFHEIKSRNYKKPSRAKVWQKRLATLALVTGIVASANLGYGAYESIKSHHEKVELMQEGTQQMIAAGYHTVPDQNGNWDSNYHLLNEIDLINIYALMGADETENVLKARGFESWDAFLEKEGYESRREWRETEINARRNEGKVK